MELLKVDPFFAYRDFNLTNEELYDVYLIMGVTEWEKQNLDSYMATVALEKSLFEE